ncbi:outer membrane lipid asymmetry maintenance protein MlaD [Hydromonas duriensis]|uniref:Phospholipid/cholesterol/gamma-HCH transport system substrate-binding protein n=1 Tax=Hydromonas duriensis TaxID=1527608 RepID=A0A4R6Y690_9BURK|nr:outer membrane lipid asymmetry maintenance protein MlaD [Hydromonas duriensis]TDR30978.1 phospholipid/cholesterol/gamma-HCH transport system substrate-binding protein [Hydromonas duriensis]
MQQKKIDIWVGFFVLLGIVGLVALALVVGGRGGLSTKSGYPVMVNFQNIGTLKERAPVKMSGVVIGRVGGIELKNLGGEYKAQVTLIIDDGLKIPQDSGASINTAGLLGAQFISLTQGADIEHPVAAGGTLDNSQSAMVLEDLITQFGINKAESSAKSESSDSAEQSK